MKLFGKRLFEKKVGFSDSDKMWKTHLYDFQQHGGASMDAYTSGYVTISEVIDGTDPTSKKKATKKPKNITPKELYNLDTLQDQHFQIKVGPEYIAKEQKTLEKKVKLMIGDHTGNKYGKLELKSMIERLGNRLRIEEFIDVVEEYPHTSTARVNDILKSHDNLRFKNASEFIPDFPDEAVEAMQRYKDMCQSLCGKEPIFYVIADKKDFGEKDRRRDPILLAQSPFGFFWQILGAWDEEMIYLGDL